MQCLPYIKFETNFSNRELKKDTLLIPQCCFSLIWLTDSIIPHAVSGSSNITPSGPGVYVLSGLA